MAEPFAAQDEARRSLPAPETIQHAAQGASTAPPTVLDEPLIHEASSTDADAERDWEARLLELLVRGDLRDLAAEVRDRQAEARSTEVEHPGAWIDREWAARDRDAAAADRSDLLDLLRERGLDRPEAGPQ